MKVSNIKASISASYEVKQPLMIWGGPGCAKSSTGQQSAAELGIDFIDMRLSLHEPQDLMGFPMLVGDQMKFSKPPRLPQKGKGILMLDEIVQASPAVQAAASSLILDRCVGEYKLPAGWHVIAAGNRKSDRASANSMPMHIANRFIHLNMEVSVEEWVTWALQANVDVRVIAYIKWRPDALYEFKPLEQKGEAFPSPRSWEFASKMLGTKLPRGSLLEIVTGTVGEGRAAEFVGFLDVCDKLPSVDAILLAPGEAPVPIDGAVLYALQGAIVNRATKDNLNKIAQYYERVKAAGRPEFAVITQREIALRKPELCNTRAYIEWAAKLSDLTA